VKLGPDGEPRPIDLKDENERRDLYDKIVSTVKHFFQDGLQEFLEKSAPIKKVGFASELA